MNSGIASANLFMANSLNLRVARAGSEGEYRGNRDSQPFGSCLDSLRSSSAAYVRLRNQLWMSSLVLCKQVVPGSEGGFVLFDYSLVVAGLGEFNL